MIGSYRCRMLAFIVVPTPSILQANLLKEVCSSRIHNSSTYITYILRKSKPSLQ